VGHERSSIVVSVIVPTRNSERTLDACLQSIRDQSHPEVELIVVDNGSTDGTPEIARRHSDHFFSHGPERSAQRNFGVEHARGDYVVLIDSDMVLEPGVVTDGVSALREPAVRGVVIPELSFGEGYWSHCRMLERQCYVGDDDVEAARMFRRDDFLAVGGYDLELNGAEDWDLSARIAGRANLPRTDSYIHHDEGRTTLYGSFVKRRYYAPGYLRYLAKHKNDAISQGNSVLRPAFLRHWRDMLRHPLHAVGMFLLKFVELIGVLQVAVEQRISKRSRARSGQLYASLSPSSGAPTPGAATADGQRGES
jgi:glycosyltransferase involved in cell wall biosynthesis